MKIRTTVTSVIAGASLALATSVALAPVGHADTVAVTCYGDYCSGQDPTTTGCDQDAVTLESVPISTGAGQLDLRWSPTCKTNWARWQQYPTGCLNCAPTALYAVQDTGYSQTVDFYADGAVNLDTENGGTYWTPMIYSPVHAVYAAVDMPCGDSGLVAAAMDCLINSREQTHAY